MKHEEKKNRNKALLASIAVHSILLLLLLFAIAWRAPNPPHPEYGIEINFGTSDVGSGELQPETTPTTTDQEIESAEQEEEQAEQTEEQTEQEITEQSAAEKEPVETESPSKVESPVKAKNTEQEVKVTEPVKEKTTEQTKKTTEQTKTPVETKQVEKTKTDQTEGKDKQSTTTSQGDNKEQVGDKGKEEGTLDAKAMLEQGGGDEGITFEGFKGYILPEIKIPDVPADSYGVYEFTVTVDKNGDIKGLVPKRRGLSLEAEKIIKNAIDNAQFIPSGSNLPDESTGTITVRIVSGKEK